MPKHPLITALLLFAFGLSLRWLFWLAGPPGGPGWQLGYQGDAPVWQQFAVELAAGTPGDELRLPWRAPGMQWLVGWLWDGTPQSVHLVEWVVLLAGAGAAPLLWWLLRGTVAPQTALLAAWLCAAASNLLLLASGVHVEACYLLLTLLALLAQRGGAGKHPWRAAIAAGALHALACLLRSEHLLTAGLLLLLAAAAGTRPRQLLAAVLTAGTVLLPWQLAANHRIDAYNGRDAAPPPLPAASLPWTPAAVQAIRELPAFQQAPVFAFVQDTARIRGHREVRPEQLAIIREAYGCWPAALPYAPICLYGPLNFWLANTAEANGGFASTALDRPPPLAGGDASYPPGLRQVLPRGGQLAFSYPPHLDRIVHGYRHGWAEISADPLAALRRTGRKLWQAAAGATGGLGGLALPIGLSGERRAVDTATADSAFAQAWRLLLLLLAGYGCWQLRRQRELWPLFWFAASKLVTVVLFFGYARQGALCLPLVALGLAAAAAPLWRRWPRLAHRKLWLLLAVLLLLLEAWRTTTGVSATLDGLPASHGEPFGARDWSPRRIQFGLGQ